MIARLAAAWRALIAFVEDREDPAAVALARIVVCTGLWTHMAEGLVTGGSAFVWSRAPDGIAAGDGWLSVIGGATPAHVVGVCVVCMVSAFMASIGWLTKPSLFVAWLTFRALCGLNGIVDAGYDGLMLDVMVPLFLSGCDRAFSVDAWRRRAREPEPVLVARWPRMLLVMQIGLLYGGTALMKASAGWVPGGSASALWFILHQPPWTRFFVETSLPLWLYPLTQLATTTTWLFEVMGPLFVVAVFLRERPSGSSGGRLKRLLDRVHFREAWLAYGIALHVGIEVTMEVGAFFLATMALYVCALRPREWRALLARVARRRQPPG